MIKDKTNDNTIGDFGKIYKLTSLDPMNNNVYIGSTKGYYFSVRLCQHVENWRNGKDYKGIFNEQGKCFSQIIETIPKNENYISKLRHLERYHLMNQTNSINIRKPCYYDEIERKDAMKRHVKKYHQSEKGQLSLKKATLKSKIKKCNAKIEELAIPINELLLNDTKKKESKIITCKNDYEIAKLQDKMHKITEERNKLVTEILTLGGTDV